MGPSIWTIFVIYICSHKRNNGDRAWLPRSPVTGTGAARDSDAPRPPLPAANRRPILFHRRREAADPAAAHWPRATATAMAAASCSWWFARFTAPGHKTSPPPPRRRSPARDEPRGDHVTWRGGGGPPDLPRWVHRTARAAAESNARRGTRQRSRLRFVGARPRPPPPLHCRPGLPT